GEGVVAGAAADVDEPPPGCADQRGAQRAQYRRARGASVVVVPRLARVVGQQTHASHLARLAPSTASSTASHPRRTSSSTAAPSSVKRPRTYAETTSGSLLGGRPTPRRMRMKSALPSSRRSDLSPL